MIGMLPTDDCDDCLPSYLQQSQSALGLTVASFPFLLTWFAVTLFAQQRLFPALASDEQASHKTSLPTYHKSTPQAGTRGGTRWGRFSRRQLARTVFSTSAGLSTVLVELLLCEISDTLDPVARGLALKLTLGCLLILGVLLTPALEVHNIVEGLLGSRPDTTTGSRSSYRLRRLAEACLLAIWLFSFWYIPQMPVVRRSMQKLDTSLVSNENVFRDGCLQRVGIIGIFLMASLAGFAAVSSLWQTCGAKHRAIKESELSTKEAGLAATQGMLDSKRSRFRALQQKVLETPSSSNSGIAGRLVRSFRSNPDEQELKTLQMEISGLETMRFTLDSSLSSMRARYTEQIRTSTSSGKVIVAFNYGFAVFCAYRICTTILSVFRRWVWPTSTFITNDPVNRFLAIVTAHWDSHLDVEVWVKQISFLLSGVMLLASFNAVHQTFRLFSRFAPRLVQHAQTSLPLIISQVASVYVISSALLLRSSLPWELRGVISDALGAKLDGLFVEAWFDGWFLVSVGLTTVGIFIGRRFGSEADDDWDDDGSGMRSASKLH